LEDAETGSAAVPPVLHVGRNDAARYFHYIMELADDANAESNARP
jgi:hypothetical protein